MNKLFNSILSSFKRCKKCILSIFIVYCFSCFVGIMMVHNGNDFALKQRDKIVNHAIQENVASINYQSGNRFKAAAYDFLGNLSVSIPQTFLGLTIVFPYLTVSYQGWVGGIVSVDHQHNSRLKNVKTAIYYLLVLLLQFIPYSLTIGAGVKSGIDIYKQNIEVGWNIRKYRIKKQNIFDVGNMYLISIPLFFFASSVEFFSSWNI
jgi:hypothetical protein